MLSSKLDAINNVSQKIKNKYYNHPEKTPFRYDIDIDNSETTTSTSTSTASQSHSESEKEQSFKKRRVSRLFSWIKKT